MVDLRTPIGWFFAITGRPAARHGNPKGPDTRAALTDINVDLYCGLFMTLFGAFLLLLVRRGRPAAAHDGCFP